MPILQSFAALYVLIMAILGPLLSKESKLIYNLVDKVVKFKDSPNRKKPKAKPLIKEKVDS